MPRAKRKKHKIQSPAKAGKKLDLLRPGMPAVDSIVDVKEFKKGKKTYRIIRTNEIDEYEDQPPPKQKK